MRRPACTALIAAAAALPFALPVRAQTVAPPPDAPVSTVDDLALRPTEAPDGTTIAVAPPPDDTTGRVPREPPVPPLADTSGAAVTDADSTGDDDTTGSVPIVHRPPATDPYEPLGIRAGGFVAYPSLTTTFGDTTNAQGAAGGVASAYVILSPELSLRSDWDRNAATFDLRASNQHFFSDPADDHPEVDATGTGRLDLTDSLTLPLTASYTFTTQSPSDPDFPGGVTKLPGVHELKGTVGLDRTGPTVVQAEANVDRTIYENAMAGAVIVDQSDRDNTVYGSRLRLGYTLTPSLTPFVEADVGRRAFDQTVDNDGLRRSGLLQYYRAGATIDRGPVLTGELALGYGTATFDDPSLASFSAFTVDGNLVWAPTELATVTLSAKTTLNPSDNPASSGSVAYNGGLDLAYAWRDNVTLDATATASSERFQGTGEADTDTHAGLAATWKANRVLWLTAGYQHQWLASNVPGKPFQADEVSVGLTTQR